MQAVARARLVTVGTDTVLAEVARLLSSAEVSVVVVCTAAGTTLGIITETVLIRRLGLQQADFFATRAEDVMNQDFTACAPADTLSGVLAMMHFRGLVHVLLLDPAGTPLGVVYARDGLRALLAAGNEEEELLRSYVTGVGYR
jgi:CBS domain-containing protein